MPTISRAYHAHSGNYTPGGNTREYIVIHNTGNTAPAINEAKYAQNNQHASSYHYVLDGGGTIYQVLDDWDTAWSVGAWSGAKQLIANRQTINIEVVSDSTQFTEAEVQELAWLVGQLMSAYNIPASHVVRHYDCHTGRKLCPGFYSGVGNVYWPRLHERITEGDDMEPVDVWAYKNRSVNPDYIDVYDMLTRCTKAAEKIEQVAEKIGELSQAVEAIGVVVADINARLDDIEKPGELDVQRVKEALHSLTE